MTIKSIDEESFELVKLLTLKPREKTSENTELIGSIKERKTTNLTDKIVGGMVGRSTNHLGETTDIFLYKENEIIGFNENDYLKFKSLVQKIQLLEKFQKIVSFNFIESESFDWLIKIFKNKKAESTLSNYLSKSVSLKVKFFTFYFPILNMRIETPFKIGNVDFMYFKKDYFDNLFESLIKKNETMTEEIFERMFRKDFQGIVLAKVTIQAEKDRAEQIAKLEAEISVDILKMYSDSVIIPEKQTMFDLNFRLGYQVQSNFLTQTPNDKDNLNLNVKFNNHPFNYTKRHNLVANKSGLNIFSNYITQKPNNELREIIIQSIQLFSSAISNWDLHLRCVSLITIIESIFLKNDERGEMERKTKARLSKIITNNHNEKERIKLLFSNIYQVRHKMIHKAKRININLKELSEVQMIMVNLFLSLIHFNTKLAFLEKVKLIDKLNEIKS
jgi:hypothetical protein